MHKFPKHFISFAICGKFGVQKNCKNNKITRTMTDTNGRDDETSSDSMEFSWRGCSLQEIYRNLNEFELDHVQPVKVSQDHTILYHCPIRNIPETEPPRPLRATPKWDAHHVRLPCSDKSQYPVTQADGNSTIESRWEMIQKALLRPIQNSHELEKAILAYNSKYENVWKFKALHKLFEDDLDESEAQVFFEDLLPRIIRLALQLPELVQAPIPLLKQKHSHSVTLSQQQVSCLLANAFLCTFPRRNTLKKKSEYSTFPDINFNRLFQSSGQAVLEKLKCICHYFRRVCPTERDSKNVPSGVVTFTRRTIEPSKLPDWNACDAPLGITPLHITSAGTIEDQGLGLLQVDFANKFLGGGVLGQGCVQEEIRFVICPELIVSKLFTECLRPNEALLMIGCERYSNYNGYAGTFQWAGNHEDCIPRDSSRRRMTHIVAIDALAFNTRDAQYCEELMLRELNKAYVGFLHELKSPAPGVASGNWGCGAFGGEARLKALIQLMTCTITNRPLVYYTFGDSELRDVVHRMHTFFIEKNVRVCELWQLLKKFKPKGTKNTKDLYEYLYNEIQNPTKNHSWKGCQLTLKRMFSSKKVESTTTQKVTNISQDLFASSSETELETENKGNSEKSPKTSLSSKIALETRITISDDSETDELLLAAVAEIATSSKADSASLTATTTSDTTPSKKKSPKQHFKQRTLVEMLDQCYTNTEGSPASKRQCTTKQGPNQNS